MSYIPTYRAAGKVARQLEKHFIRHIGRARKNNEEDLAPLPGSAHIAVILDAAFWASLRKEEGHSPRISLAYMPPVPAQKPLLFSHPVKLNPNTLSKIAPGVERGGIHLGVWEQDGELYVWGTSQKTPNYCFVTDVSEPGLLVIKHRRPFGLGKFTNVAVLKGDQIKIIKDSKINQAETPAMVKSLLGINSPVWNHPDNVLIQLAVSMRAHGRGGCILVVDDDKKAWKQSIVSPMQYVVNPVYRGLSELICQGGESVSELYWQTALRREIDHIAGLTAIDGATIISQRYELISFGAKITRGKGMDSVEQVILNEPVVGGGPIEVYPGRLGGTRHLSAAQFIHDQKKGQALVASQDGHFTVFSWNTERQMVQAHRIDTLLL